MNDVRIIRDRQADADDDLGRSDVRPPAAARSAVATTTTVGTYPTTANAWYAVVSQGVAGTEEEGASASFSSNPGTFYAYNIGSAIPATATKLLIHCIGGKWIFRWDG